MTRYKENCFYGAIERLSPETYVRLELEKYELFRLYPTIARIILADTVACKELPNSSIAFLLEHQE